VVSGFPVFIFGMAMIGASVVFWGLALCLAVLGCKRARRFWKNLGSRRRCIIGVVEEQVRDDGHINGELVSGDSR
jgi:hypothetical protein